MKKKLSIKDIADQLKVSKTTVSFVLNGKAAENGVSRSMERKVLAHIEKVGYRPSKMAQGLRTGRSKTIGMMVEDISDSFFSSIARRFEEILSEKGYRIIYGSTENSTAIAKELIQVFRNHQVDGYIIAPPPGISDEIKALLEDNIPTVLFDRPLPDVETDTVLVDNYRGAFRATRHFIENGYRQIAMITLSSQQSQMRERERGYLEGLASENLHSSILQLTYHETKEKAISEIETFLRSQPEIDAVFFATNYLAENGLEALVRLNKAIPDDIGVIVFDDNNWFRLYKPSLTAISQPIHAICNEVVDLLFNRLEQQKTAEPKSILLATTLMIRQSSAQRIPAPLT